MNISSRVNGALKQWGLFACLGITVLMVLLAALGFLIAAFYTYLATRMSHAGAAACTGGGLIVLAAVIGGVGAIIIKRMKKPQPSLIAEFSGTIGLGTRLLYMLVRRDPKKAVILAAVTGAIAEYIVGDSRKK